MRFAFLILCLVDVLHFTLSAGSVNSLESVPDLENSMYTVIDGFPCVRLLNISGEVGCSNPGRDIVVAPIIRYNNIKNLAQLSAVLVPLEEFRSFFSRIAKDTGFARNVGGVLIESGSGVQNKLREFSPDDKFPQAQFASYQSINHDWNAFGTGLMWNAYNFPVFLLSETSTLKMQEFANKNAEGQKSHTIVVEFNLRMQTTKSGTHDSASCLKEGTCLPLGGYSVWSSLPAINISTQESSKPIILTVTSMDSASFFRDKSLGANSPLSGLISLLAAVDALSHMDDLENLRKQLVFLVLTGEAWGYLGSRRFQLELDLNSDAVRGLNSSLIEMVLEIGSVGKSSNQGIKRFFAHTAMVSSATNETLDALQHAQDSLKSAGIKITKASSTNPGLPPSSLMALLKKNSHAAGVVLEDFDGSFTNKFYHSHLDDLSNINSSSVVAAASLVARTLYILASGNENLSSSALSAINVNASLVDELLSCLLSCEPGLFCRLVKDYISSTAACPNHYVGVLLGEPSATPYLGYVDDVSRFIWNFLAHRTSLMSGAGSACSGDCGGAGEVCVKVETDEKGECVTSTTRYVPAYSTRLKFESGIWHVLPPNSSDPMGMVDPVWTESNWDEIELRAYKLQDATYDKIILFGGITVTTGAYIAILIVRTLIAKALKRD